VVGGQFAAQLMLRSASEDPLLLELAADRLSGILALALAQAFRPSPAQVAEARLLEAVVEGGDRDAIGQLWVQAGLKSGYGAIVALFRTDGRDAKFPAVERALQVRGVQVKSHLWDGERAVLLALPHQGARAGREALLNAAREALAGSATCAAFGPNVADGTRAHDSYVEAREVLRLGMPAAGDVLDAMDFLGRRILAALPQPAFVDSYVESALGEVLEWDRKHGTALLATLLCWLDSGCNTTASAASLNIERQTMHKRLSKIQALLGGDPRTSGRLFGIHIAAAAAASFPRPPRKTP
jgi:purine catabolism regulator